MPICAVCSQTVDHNYRGLLHDKSKEYQDALYLICGSYDGKYICNVCYRSMVNLGRVNTEIRDSKNTLAILENRQQEIMTKVNDRRASSAGVILPCTSHVKLAAIMKQHTPVKVGEKRNVDSSPSSLQHEQVHKKIDCKATPRKLDFEQANVGIVTDVGMPDEQRSLLKSLSRDETFVTFIYQGMREQFVNIVLNELHHEIRVLCKSGKSSLQLRNTEQLTSIRWSEILLEWETYAPLFFAFLKTVTCKVRQTKKGFRANTLVSVGSSLIFARNQRMSVMQHVVGLILDSACATDEVISLLNKMCICVSKSSIYKNKVQLKEKHEETMRKRMVEFVGAEKNTADVSSASKFYVAGDNVDLLITPTYITREEQRKSLHWFLLVGVNKRVTDDSLPDATAQADISSISCLKWLPCDDEISAYEQHCYFHVQRVLLKYGICSFLQEHVPEVIEHPYMDKTSLPSEFFVADLLECNENTSEGMIEIMKCLHRLFIRRSDSLHPEVLEHTEFAGDVLTTERAFAAQCDMSNGLSSYERLSGCNYRPGGLHLVMNLTGVRG